MSYFRMVWAMTDGICSCQRELKRGSICYHLPGFGVVCGHCAVRLGTDTRQSPTGRGAKKKRKSKRGVCSAYPKGKLYWVGKYKVHVR